MSARTYIGHMGIKNIKNIEVFIIPKLCTLTCAIVQQLMKIACNICLQENLYNLLKH